MTKIILKADDYVMLDKENEAWTRFNNYTNHEQIKVAVGVICQSLENYEQIGKPGDVYSHLELFIHSYKHKMDEYIGNVHVEHRKNIAHCLALMKTKLGVEAVTFGAPGNNMSRLCWNALKDTKKIKIVFYNVLKKPSIPGKILLPIGNGINIESPCHEPNLKHLKEIYDKDAELYVFQLHPQSWDWNRFQQFMKCIDYIKEQGGEFILPREMIQS